MTHAIPAFPKKVPFLVWTLLLAMPFSPAANADDTLPLQLGIHQVGSWHAASDSELLLEDHHRNQYRVILRPPCEGLKKAKSIAFISNDHTTLNGSSSVILPDGKRCPFKDFRQQSPTNNQ